MFDNSAKLNLLFNGKIGYNCPQDKVPKLDISEGEDLILALDPSSSQTGFVIGNPLGKVYVIGDYINFCKVLSKNEYASYLKDYLTRLTAQYPIKYFTYEVPFTPGAQDIATKVLTFMESTFRSYSNSINGLELENTYPILPAVWRKTYFKDSKYAGRKRDRENLKLIAQERAIELFPEYTTYLSDKAIPDSTDALGVYYGFIEENWFDYAKGVLRVSKTNSRYSRNHAITYKVTLHDAAVLARDVVGEVTMFAYNKEFNVEDTVKIVTSQTENTCIILPYDDVSRDRKSVV